MLTKLSILVLCVIVWVLYQAVKRGMMKSYSNDLARCEEACTTFMSNTHLPIGSMGPMKDMLAATRTSFDEGTLTFTKFLPRLQAMQNFFKDIEYIASPLLLYHVGEKRFSRALNDLITDALPRAIANAKASAPERGSRVALAIERAEQALRDAGNAGERQLIFAYRRCAIAKAEMEHYAAFI